MLDILEEELKAIELKIEKKKKEEIHNHKDQIMKLIASEICSRYYFQTGRIQNKLGDDKDVLEAIEILSDKDRYNSILSGEQK